MLSAVILTVHGYPASTVGTITGTPEVRLFRSSRTKKRSSQYSNAYTGYGPNCLTTFWTQLACRFHGRTAQPLGQFTAPGCDEPTSRCQTSPSIWTLGGDQPVIPRVTFIRLATTLPHRIVGTLRPTFVLVRLVSLTIKLFWPLHSTTDFRPVWKNLCTPPLLFGRRPPQSNCPPDTVP